VTDQTFRRAAEAVASNENVAAGPKPTSP
jgi:hypothetical protein